MNINKSINTTIITDNNVKVLEYFKGENIVSNPLNLKLVDSDFVVLNDVLRYLKDSDVQIFLKKLESKNIHFVNITSKIEEVLYAQRLIVYTDDKVQIEGPVISVLKEERILKKLGFGLPFIYDLSLQLNYYGLIDSIYLDEKVLVDKLW